MKYQTNNNNVASEVMTSDLALETEAVLGARPYETPILISYGDVRDITLGGTFGFGESGAGFNLFEPD